MSEEALWLAQDLRNALSRRSVKRNIQKSDLSSVEISNVVMMQKRSHGQESFVTHYLLLWTTTTTDTAASNLLFDARVELR